MTSESQFFADRRRQREQLLERVGVGTESGQRLIERWGREASSEAIRTSGSERVATDAASGDTAA